MTSKKTIAVLLVIGIILSILTIWFTVIKFSSEKEPVYPNFDSSSGKVDFYVKEKLEPQTITGKVSFDVVEKNEKGDANE